MDSNNSNPLVVALPPVTNFTSPPVVTEEEQKPSALSILQKRRDELLEVVAKSLTPDKVEIVLNAVFLAASGANGKVDVAAAKLYLAYGIGNTDNIAGGKGDKVGPVISEEDFKRLESIASKHSKKLTNIRVVKRVKNRGEADVISTQTPKETTGSGEGSGEGSEQAAE